MLYREISLSLYTNSRVFIQLIQHYLNEFNLTYPQYLVLSILWEEDGILVKEIGERLHLDSGTLTPLIKKLESVNYVKRHRGESDERTVHVELTYPGKSLQSKVQLAMIKLEEKLIKLKHLNLPELNQSLDILLESVETLKNSTKE
jgi:DNA-binding MarR family transcriptional regulator